MFQTGEPELSEMTEKECKAYKAFWDFHEQYLASGGRAAELSDIMCSTVDKVYPSVPPDDGEQALTAED